MKGFKRILGILTVFMVMFANLTPLFAVKASLEVKQTKGIDVRYSYEAPGNSGPMRIQYGRVTRMIESYDQKTGEIYVKVEFQNKYNTEVIFLVDNKGAVAFTTSVTAGLAKLANFLIDNGMKVGFQQIDPDAAADSAPLSNVIALTNDKTAAGTAISAISASPNTATVDLKSALTVAEDSFSESAERKLIIPIMDSFSETSASTFAGTMESMESDELMFRTLLLTEFTNTNAINAMFGSTVPQKFGLFRVDTATLEAGTEETTKAQIFTTLPGAKTDFIFTDTISQDIIDNFTVTAVGDPTAGTVNDFNTTTREYTWQVPTIEGNQNYSFTYKLTLKSDVNSSALNKTMGIVDSGVYSFKVGGNTASFGISENDDNCIPQIRLVQPTETNPGTGVIETMTPYLIVAMVALCGFLYFRNKEAIVQL